MMSDKIITENNEFIREHLKEFMKFAEKQTNNEPREKVIMLSQIIANFVCSAVRAFSNPDNSDAFPSNMLDMLNDITEVASFYNHKIHNCDNTHETCKETH